jgi:hypothetical protein
MSYKCQQCKHQVLPRIEQKQVIVEVRQVLDVQTRLPRSEIARTISVCPSCAGKHAAMGGRVV